MSVKDAELRKAHKLLGEVMVEREELQKLKDGDRTLRHGGDDTIKNVLTNRELDDIRDAIEAKIEEARTLLAP